MKTMKFVVLCAAFALGALSVGAGPVARIGETDYGTLEEAVAAGGKIRLLSDVALDSLLVPSDAEVTLDLAGHSLTGTQQDRAAVVVYGSLTVDDSVGGGRITHEGAVVISKKIIRCSRPSPPASRSRGSSPRTRRRRSPPCA